MGSVHIALLLTFILSKIIAFCFPSSGALSYLVWLLYPIILRRLSRYISNRKRGVVTPTGLKRYNSDTEITFDMIESITGAQGLQNIVTANTSAEIYLPKQEIVKLSKTPLNNWTINNYSINIIPAMAGEFLSITYSPVGKYTFNLMPMLYIFVVSSIFFMHSVYGLFIPILGIVIYYSLQKYSLITVRIHDGGVSIIEKRNEIFISFSDIQTVKKNMFYTRINTKDKRAFILPKRCLYLFELLEFYSSNNK